ncbi:hypothetical protein ACOMHN_059629 [Nucella lapillus]
MATTTQRPSRSAQLATGMMMMAMVVMMMGVPALSLLLDDVNTRKPHTPTPTPNTQGSKTDQCNEGLPPPDQPFRVVWNHPDTCEKNGYPLRLEQWGFTFNKNRQFLGEEVQTLYQTGNWPTISKTGKTNNGGLPQLFTHPPDYILMWEVFSHNLKPNFTGLAIIDFESGQDNSGQLFTHPDNNLTWEKLSHSVKPNFTGVAIIDFESWRAIFATNFGNMRKYQLESIKLVQQQHPEYNHTTAKLQAEREWHEAAKSILSTKLAIGQKLMPGGHWGYYGYPRTWGPNGNTEYHNNKISWLWRQSTGLFPRIYITDPNLTVSHKVSYVGKNVREAVRVQNEFSPPNTPIYPFSNFQQGDDIFFQQDHLSVTLRLPADMGAGGVVLWGSSSYYRNATRQCSRLQDHLKNVLGPFVLNLTRTMTNCSQDLCWGRGRCVHNSHDHLLGETESLRLSGLCSPRDSPFQDYHCRCYSPWQGPCCQSPRPSPCQDDNHNGHEAESTTTHHGGQNRGSSTETPTTPEPDTVLIG